MTGLYGMNVNATNVNVVCPINRHVHKYDLPGNGFLAGSGLLPQPMHVYKPNGSYFKCYYQATDYYAGSYVWSSAIPQGSGNTPLYMNGLTVSTAQDLAHYTLLCDVPPGGKIYNYIIAEHQW